MAIKDCPVMQWGIEEVRKFITSFSPDLIIMETSAPSFTADTVTAEQLTGIPLCAAGFHATAAPKLHLESGFTYVFCGEYEYHVSDFVKAIENSSVLPVYIGHAGNPSPSHSPLIDDLDLLPYPLRDDLLLSRYHDPFSRSFNITMISSKGCTHNCSFCSLTPYLGKTIYRKRSVRAVVDEMLYLIQRYSPNEILFDDDSITVDRGHCISLCKEICGRAPGIVWSCMGNVPIDDECAFWMAKAGCRAIKLGVESGVQCILDSIPKGITLGQIQATFNILRKHRIKRHATVMVGLPGDTRQGVAESVRFILSLKPDTVQFSTATPYPGTAFYEKAVQNKWIQSTSYEDFDGAGLTPLSYPSFSKEEIQTAFHHGLKRWHRYMLLHKPGTLLHHLKNYLFAR